MFKTLIFGFALCAAGITAHADDLSPADARSVRHVVEAQLKALASERPSEAFAYASPGIQQQFRDAEGFATMVRQRYPMLIRPASVGFFQPASEDGAVFQAVHFRDREGHLWRAVYELQRQPDKSWRINGCAVSPDDEASTT